MLEPADIEALYRALLADPAPRSWRHRLVEAGAERALDATESDLGLRAHRDREHTLDHLLRIPLAPAIPTHLDRARGVRRVLLRRAIRPRLGLDADGSALEGWLREVGLDEAIDRPALEVVGHGPLAGRPGTLGPRTLPELFDLPRSQAATPPPLRPGSRVIALRDVAALARALEDLVVARRDHGIFLERLRGAAWAPTAEAQAALDPLRRDLLASEPALVGPVSLTGWAPDASARRAWIVRDRRGARVAAWRPLAAPGQPALILEPGREADRARVLATLLDGVLDRRLHEALDDHRAPPPPPALRPPPSEGPALGFRIGRLGGHPQVQTVAVTPGSRRPRLKKLALHEARKRPDLTDAERRALRRLRTGELMPGRGVQQAEAVHGLVGHPWVFPDGKAREPAAVRPGRPSLVVDAVDGWARLSWRLGEARWTALELDAALAWPLDEDQPYGIIVTDSRIWVFEASPAWVRLYRWVVGVGGWAPPATVEPLIATLDDVDAVELQLSPTLEGRHRPAATAPGLRLTSLDDGLSIDIEVQPVPGGRHLLAGRGVGTLRGRDERGRWTVVRDLDAERDAAAELWRALDLPGSPGPVDLDLPDAVDLLRRLDSPDAPAVRWTGAPTTVHAITAGGVRVELTGVRLLELGGTLTVDDEDIPLAAVLQALRGGRSFVRLDGRRLARLERALADRLERLADMAWTTREGTEQVGAAAALALDALAELGVAVDAPPAWTDRLRRLREATTTEPALPDGLRATLRPYQARGVRWALRLASWGLGGVLADDMGLGKTLQALTVLLARAAEGPALVVAPTSVVGTWAREAARFTPDLTLHTHHGAGRAASLDHLTAGDVLLTSWGTLVADADLIAATPFATVVLDEAHAIKNPRTRRAAAARDLQAGFVLALTGTPVENHPTELWSLMRVVAPGLLGSREAFEERFARPILGESTSRLRDRLGRIVRPFLLRRTKAEVAPDLPAREEIVVPVTLSDEERAVYEGLRRAGLGELDTDEVDAVRILAVLTRLRQAASHAGLLVDHLDDSAKLRAARRTLADLREAGHRALVFSGFTSLLDVLADQLVAEGARVGRLDGRVSRTAREAAVDAFQAGETDVLLLSLQAGGVGLTLTAASYVLHLDPWWNPAVQDQATDRAHRIGQDQPVTVLHFIAQDTLEVGIRALQEDKRELVDALLAGSDRAARLDAATLLRLVRDGGQAVASETAAEALWGGDEAGEDRPATAEAPTTWQGLAEALDAHLADRVLSGDLQASSAGVYRGQIRRLVQTLQPRPAPRSREDLAAAMAWAEQAEAPPPSTRAAWRRIARQWSALLPD